MRLFLLSQEPPFDAGQVATGNALRTDQLRRGLENAGHSIESFWLSRKGGPGQVRSADELRGVLQRVRPDVILVSYWELLELLPFEPPAPVVLDFLAPRPLEALFETPERVGGLLRRLRVALARVDLLLVGNREQAGLLAYWLLEAGFDLRSDDPVRIVPLAGEPVARGAAAPAGPLQLVSGGVSWPWREDGGYRAALESALRALDPTTEKLKLTRFGGEYRWHEAAGEENATSGDTENSDDAALTGEAADRARPLAPYREWSAFLRRAHIGLELGKDNLERRFSQSFRSLDFLRHGMPLLCTAGQPLAREVQRFGAGWVVERPEALPAVLETLAKDPAAWQAASENAYRLLAARHAPATAIAPLLDWLHKPARAKRLPGYGLPDPTPPVLGRPPVRQRLTRRYRLARRIVLARALKAARNDEQRKAIVLCSREDLFPTDHGAAVKIVETARGLSRNGREVLLVTQNRRHYWRVSEGQLEQRPLPRWTALSSWPQALVKWNHYTLDIPESDAFLYLPLSDGSFFWRLLWVAARHRAGVLQAEFPAYALPCQQVGEVLDLPTVLVQHNVEYARLKAQLPQLTDEQFERFRAIEIDLCNRSDAVICVSDNDRQRLAADGVHPGRLHTIPHGIDLSSFDEARPAPARERFAIPIDAALLVYHGTFAYPPNRDALSMLASEILPRLAAKGIVAHVLAVGHHPPPDLHPRIHCTGSVEQVAPWLKAADIAVVPLREGGGTRMKIIDDFAARLPVVATSKGIEGIPASDGVEALIRNDWDGFSEAVAMLLREPEKAAALAAGGRALADQLDWSAIGARYLALMGTLER